MAFLHPKNETNYAKLIKWPKITFEGPILVAKVIIRQILWTMAIGWIASGTGEVQMTRMVGQAGDVTSKIIF